MKMNVIKSVCAIALAGVAFPVLAANSEPTGKYTCTGNTADNTKYTSQLMIDKAPSGDSYSFGWQNNSGEQYSGVGYMADNNFYAMFKNTTDPNKSGVIVYKIQSNGLSGTYVRSDDKKVEKETCTKQQ